MTRAADAFRQAQAARQRRRLLAWLERWEQLRTAPARSDGEQEVGLMKRDAEIVQST